MSKYEEVKSYIVERCKEIQAEWNGDLPGVAEDNASKATELLDLLDEVDKLMQELDI